jgi:hypothetical protein
MMAGRQTGGGRPRPWPSVRVCRNKRRCGQWTWPNYAPLGAATSPAGCQHQQMEVHHAGLAATVNAGPGGGQFFVNAGRRFQAHQAEGAMAPGGGFLWAASSWGGLERGVEEHQLQAQRTPG